MPSPAPLQDAIPWFEREGAIGIGKDFVGPPAGGVGAVAGDPRDGWIGIDHFDPLNPPVRQSRRDDRSVLPVWTNNELPQQSNA